MKFNGFGFKRPDLFGRGNENEKQKIQAPNTKIQRRSNHQYEAEAGVWPLYY